MKASTSSLKTQGLLTMVNLGDNNRSAVEPETSHKCGLTCLGPLTFHGGVAGSMVCLSEGGRLAQRVPDTFKNGLVFSSRPVKVQERIRFRVENSVVHWHGALRVGFTTVSPSARSQPVPCMAIPNLTNRRGHWAAPVHESFCQVGSELEFWVSHGGTVYITSNDCRPYMLLEGVDLSQPLWAMIDIYGQTCSVYLLGSKKRGFFYSRSSCPAPERLCPPHVDNLSGLICVSSLCSNDHISLDTDVSADEVCVVCMGSEASTTLPCGHRCLCILCYSRVAQQFGTCPLCRYDILCCSIRGEEECHWGHIRSKTPGRNHEIQDTQ